MADPFTWAAVGTAASAGGGILGAIGNMNQGAAQSSMYQYQASVAAVNAQIAKQNADYALSTGETQAMVKGMDWRSKIGDTIAKMGASGVAVGQGSSADVLSSMHNIANLDQGIIRNNAARTAYGYEVTAAQDTAQVGMYNQAASDASKAGSINAFGSILGGVSSVASKWSSGSSSGIFGPSSAPGTDGSGAYS